MNEFDTIITKITYGDTNYLVEDGSLIPIRNKTQYDINISNKFNNEIIGVKIKINNKYIVDELLYVYPNNTIIINKPLYQNKKLYFDESINIIDKITFEYYKQEINPFFYIYTSKIKKHFHKMFRKNIDIEQISHQLRFQTIPFDTKIIKLIKKIR